MGIAEKGPTFFLHPAHPFFIWIFLALLCFLTFGSYWCYDIPGALQNSLISRLHIDKTEFNLLYSVYSFMNIVLVLVGGWFIDRIGLRVGAVLFCAFIALGQVIVSVGGSLPNPAAYAVMVIGRCVFSIGGESLSVAQSTFCAKWFKGKYLALSFGITLSFARVGSYVNLAVTPSIAAATSVPIAIWFGTLTCLISLVVTVLAVFSDRVRDNYISQDKTPEAPPPFSFRAIFRDVAEFPASIWLLYLVCVLYYVGVFTLISLSGQPYLMAVFNMKEDDTGKVLGVPYIMSAVLAPFLGFFVDRVGGKPYWLLLTSLMLSAAYAVLMWAPHTAVWSPFSFSLTLPPLMAVIIMGFSYSLLASSLWPCVPLLVEDRLVGTAYGIMNSIQNFGLAIASIIAGALACSDNTYSCTRPPLVFLFITTLTASIPCVLLIIYDLSHGRKLTTRKIEVDEPLKAPTETDPLLNT